MLGRWAVRLVPLLLLCVATAGAQSWTLPGDAAVAVDPQCAPDNNYESTTTTNGALFLPNDGCAAQWNVSALGAGTPVTVRSVLYKVTGHVGQICGYMEFEGAAVGQSDLMCSANDETVRAAAVTDPGNGSTLRITWHPTAWEHDNAFVCAVTLAGDAPTDPPASPPCAQDWTVAACTSGVWAAFEGQAMVVHWPAISGAATYVVATRPVLPLTGNWSTVEAHAAGISLALPAQPAGTYGFMVVPVDAAGQPVATLCTAYAVAPEAVAVPFFGGPTAWIAAGVATVGAAWAIGRRAR